MDGDVPTLLRPTSAYRSYERESKLALERVKQKATATSGRPSFGFPRNVDHYDIVYVLNHAEQPKEELRTSGMKFGRPPPRDIFTTTTDGEDNDQIRALRASRSPTITTINQQDFSLDKKDNPTKNEMNRVNSVPRNSKAVFATQDPSPLKEADQEAPHQPSNSQLIEAEKILSAEKSSQSKIEVFAKDRIIMDNSKNSAEKNDKNPKVVNKSKIPVIKMPSNPVLAVLKSRPKTTPSPSRPKQKPSVQMPSSTTLSSNQSQQPQPQSATVTADTPTGNTEGMEVKSANDHALSSITVESSSVTPNGTKIINLRLRNSFDSAPDQNDPAQKNLSLFFMAAATPSRHTVGKIPSFHTLPEIMDRISVLGDASSEKVSDEQDIGKELTTVQESVAQKQRVKSEIDFPSSLISTAELTHASEELSGVNNVKDNNNNADTEGVDINNDTEVAAHISADTAGNVTHEATIEGQFDIFPKASIALIEQTADTVITHVVAVAIEEVVAQSESLTCILEGKIQSIQDEDTVNAVAIEEVALSKSQSLQFNAHIPDMEDIVAQSESLTNIPEGKNQSIQDEDAVAAVAMEGVEAQSESLPLQFNDNIPENKIQSIQDEDATKEESILNQGEIISTEEHENQEVDIQAQSEPNLEQAEVNKSIPDENENVIENQIQELPFGTVFDVFLQRYLNPASIITEDESPRKKSKHKSKHKHKHNDKKKYHKGKQKKKIADGDFFSSDSDSGKEEDYDGDADDNLETPLHSEEGAIPLMSLSQQQTHRHERMHHCETCSMLRREKQMLRSMYKSWREVRRLHQIIHHKDETQQNKNKESVTEGEEEFTLPPDRLLSLCLQEMNKLSIESHQAIIDCYRAMASQTPHGRTIK